MIESRVVPNNMHATRWKTAEIFASLVLRMPRIVPVVRETETAARSSASHFRQNQNMKTVLLTEWLSFVPSVAGI